MVWVLTGATGWVPSGVAVVTIGAASILFILRDMHLIALPLPETRRQIPRQVLNRGRVGVFQFGFEMGTGVRTFIPASGPYLLTVALLCLSVDLGGVAAAAVGFGTGRALAPVARYMATDGGEWDEAVKRHFTWIVPTSAGMIGVLALVGA